MRVQGASKRLRSVGGLSLEGKRIFDIVCSAALMIICSQIILSIALLVRIVMGRPILYRERRAGRGGVPFDLWKFRTMTKNCDALGALLPDADRLTTLGKWLRSTSLDELPELWNVVRGDMSLIGPRPLPVRYLTRYTQEESRRHDVRPGLTGWAQINGRNAVSWEHRLAMDVWYVDNRSWQLDLTIFVRTAKAVLRREGISANGYATMPEFRAPTTD